jgi:hypothetical protein
LIWLNEHFTIMLAKGEDGGVRRERSLEEKN